MRLALERGDGAISTFSTTVVPPQAGHLEATLLYVERIVKALLWQRGGWKVYVGGPAEIGNHIKQVYSPTGARKFDYEFMGGVYEHTFEVVVTTAEAVPEAKESAMPLGRHLDGCRVGFDLGASDRKASAVVNGETVFTEEVVWDPRNQTDPEYHYQGVMDSIKRAASHMPRLDAVGGSAAGVYINNRVRVGSLYRGIPKDKFEKVAIDVLPDSRGTGRSHGSGERWGSDRAGRVYVAEGQPGARHRARIEYGRRLRQPRRQHHQLAE